MSEPNLKIEITGDATPIAEGLKTNLDAVPKGTSKLLHAFLGKRIANVDSYQKLLAVQTEKDFELIISGRAEFRDGEVIYREPLHSQLPSNTPFLIQTKIEEESENLSGCMREAIKDSLAREDSASQENLSKTFLSRWRNEAINISEPEGRVLWGKIISEENHAPGSISLTTLDVLRNLESHVAIKFEKACDYIVNDGLLHNDDIPKDDIREFRDSGLIVQASTEMAFKPHKAAQGNRNGYYLFIRPKYFAFIENPSTPNFLAYELTKAGKEICNIARKIDDDHAIKLCKFLFTLPALYRVNTITYSQFVQDKLTSNFTFHDHKIVQRN